MIKLIEVTDLATAARTIGSGTNDPVVVRGGCARFAALRKWTPAYLAERAPNAQVMVKCFNRNGDRQIVHNMSMRAYVERIAGAAPDEAGYCHDVPLFVQCEALADDLDEFPMKLLPGWYRQHWWRFCQFFMGPDGVGTPLHFDTLLTHNLFFQIRGEKRFTVIPFQYRNRCLREGWRWFGLDPGADGFEHDAAAKNIEFARVDLGPGDILHLPPGVLHHVRSRGGTISFNIDYHTRRSVIRALWQSLAGAPRANLYYNIVVATGLWLNVPAVRLMRFYRTYLNHIS